MKSKIILLSLVAVLFIMVIQASQVAGQTGYGQGTYGSGSYGGVGLQHNPGDVDGNGRVDMFDLSLVGANMGNTGSAIVPPEADQKIDGIVDVYDLVVVGSRCCEV